VSRPNREREAGEVAGAARRMIRALGRRVADADPIDLLLIVELRAEVEAAYLAAMRGQREAGFSYAEIAAGLGIRKQAVQQRLASESDVA
jgi:DNA-directed RNA polymerase specialized sigma24 family protein